MQAFKQISYQNYIELRFNQKNLDQISQQEALLKYKRNAQLLAQIFSFEDQPRQAHPVVPVITQEHLQEIENEIQQEKKAGEAKCKQIQQKSKLYAHLLREIKAVKSTQDRDRVIEELKKEGMYDELHPYFTEGSPFFLQSTEEQVLEVSGDLELPNEQGLAILDIK